jgi:hypothetical protein
LARIAEPGARFGFGFARRRSRAAQFLLAHGEVERDLVVDVSMSRLIVARDPEQSPPAGS